MTLGSTVISSSAYYTAPFVANKVFNVIENSTINRYTYVYKNASKVKINTKQLEFITSCFIKPYDLKII